MERENTKIRKENFALKKENAVLKEKLSKYKNPKNSRNSSLPPTKDENRPLRTRSLRERTGKKPGGQTGHKGNTLKMTSTPDKIADHIPDCCSCCGKDIGDLPCEVIMERQVVDIPPVQPEYTAHRVYQKVCPCGHITKSDFPPGVNTPVSYGSNVESLIGYFHCRQYIPFDRMRKYMVSTAIVLLIFTYSDHQLSDLNGQLLYLWHVTPVKIHYYNRIDTAGAGYNE